MVCDDEQYFNDTINELYQELGYTQSSESAVVGRLVLGSERPTGSYGGIRPSKWMWQ
jgi:hypothetical protein